MILRILETTLSGQERRNWPKQGKVRLIVAVLLSFVVSLEAWGFDRTRALCSEVATDIASAACVFGQTADVTLLSIDVLQSVGGQAVISLRDL